MRATLSALALAALIAGTAPVLAQGGGNQGDSTGATAGGGGSPFATNGMGSNNPGPHPGNAGTTTAGERSALPGSAQPGTADRGATTTVPAAPQR
ncbi:hypothetical protein [Muricoccus radiodurans]|uniref:hypothetical protein n=1 Tax=Muricoccus radiodurans TaxID=2231721 RepID=UPI003CEA24BC